MERLSINRLKFRAGAVPGAAGLEVDVPHVTVLVGPNNAGKSQTLRELEAYCQGPDPIFKILDSVDLAVPDTFEELRSMLELRRTKPPPTQIEQPNHFWIARPVIRSGEPELNQDVNEENLKNWFQSDEKSAKVALRQIFVRAFTMRLDGRTRFDLMEPKETGPLDTRPRNHLWALFVNDEGRERVRAFTEEAFGSHFVIDPTGMTQFRVRLANRKPNSKTEEQALDDAARLFHGQSPLISELGDGVRTSVGLVSAIMSLPDRILLIDEPEAFLHPTLARRVGRILAATARDRDASLVVATHSSEFLMGCIQSAPNLRLIRLTFSNGQASARSIEPVEITKLMNDPLLRSANALRALSSRCRCNGGRC